jgi:2-polyprenyl-3-methyl-5-hydroxy-6-metoxy-1,4-benzoquinol methylase
MKILVVGKNNLFSSLIKNFISNITFLDNIDNLEKIINSKNITHVIYDFRKSYGSNVWNTNYIETELNINLKYNLYYPILIGNICNKLNIHLTFLGEGCVFNNSDSTVPDMKTTNHSTVNIYTENILTKLYKKILYLRIRFPISGDFNPSCYLSKLISYENILDCDNSVTEFNSLIPILQKMLEKKTYGVYNFFNNGSINSLNTVISIKNNFDSLINFTIFSKEMHDKTIGIRSNGVFNNKKLNDFCDENNIVLPNIKNEVNKCINNMSKICQELKVCLCCRQKNYLLLDLGYQPLANDFHDLNTVNSNYPLNLMYCKNCFHCQLSHSVSPEILFKNYKYVSGTSKTGKDFFNWNANFIDNYIGKKGKILDIACNDGSQLDPFKKLGWETYGVDPAENICPITEKKGHKVYCDFWKDSVAEKLPIMDVITAQNVFAHTQHIDAFLQSCKKVMDNNTSLFIQTSQRDMILNGEFDTTYHEHISFFNTKSMDTLTKRNGLVLNRVLEHSIHGRSYIFEIKLIKDEKIYDVEKHLNAENNLGMYNSTLYDKFKINAEKSIMNLKLILDKYKNKGYKCIGFGAAAKGQTVICYGNIGLDYIIDESPYKYWTYSPKLNIPIVPLNTFVEDNNEKFLIVVLAWNFAKEIKEKINKCKGNKNVIVVEKYFPNLIIS